MPVYYIIALFLILLDQWSKWLIIKNMSIGEQLPIIDDFFYITSHRNQGAAWGILQGQMLFFYIVTFAVVIGIIYYLHTEGKKSKLLRIALSFILGGALGNFIDRLYRKEVVDFLDFNIFGYNFPIFNIADSMLVIGVGLLILATFREEKRGKLM